MKKRFCPFLPIIPIKYIALIALIESLLKTFDNSCQMSIDVS